LKLTRDDLTEIIKRFRETRAQFNLGNKMAGRTKAPSEKQQAKLDLINKLDIKLDL
jgi:hypothetical protein